MLETGSKRSGPEGAARARTARARRACAGSRALALALAFLVIGAVPVLAESEWCDTGSPPPNDFCLRPTGVPSASAPPEWLHSTSGGSAVLAGYQATGSIDRSQLATLQGGVANGMAHATANAPSRTSTPCPRSTATSGAAPRGH